MSADCTLSLTASNNKCVCVQTVMTVDGSPFQFPAFLLSRLKAVKTKPRAFLSHITQSPLFDTTTKAVSQTFSISVKPIPVRNHRNVLWNTPRHGVYWVRTELMVNRDQHLSELISTLKAQNINAWNNETCYILNIINEPRHNSHSVTCAVFRAHKQLLLSNLISIILMSL